MKVGDERFVASIFEGKIEIDLWVLRSIQHRKKYCGMTWAEPPKVCYWVLKLKGITWVKRSKKHHDWGWADSIHSAFRRDHLFRSAPPFPASKIGALRQLRADTNRMLKAYGPDADPECPGDIGPAAELKIIDRAIKRMKGKT